MGDTNIFADNRFLWYKYNNILNGVRESVPNPPNDPMKPIAKLVLSVFVAGITHREYILTPWEYIPHRANMHANIIQEPREYLLTLDRSAPA